MLVDVSAHSIAEAERRVREAGLDNVEFLQADLFDLSFDAGSFDHVFVCFVLEHLSRPVEALTTLMGLLQPGGTVTVIEGDHGSAYFHPDSAAAQAAIECQVELPAASGRRRADRPAGLPADGRGRPRRRACLAPDGLRGLEPPGLVDGFTKKTFTAMIEGVREPSLAAGLLDPDSFDAGIRDLYRTAGPDGTFCYCFFKGVGARAAT